MKRVESNDWRFKTDELLAHYTVLIQRQLYDLLISKGYKISYQKFNDYLIRDANYSSSQTNFSLISGDNIYKIKSKLREALQYE